MAFEPTSSELLSGEFRFGRACQTLANRFRRLGAENLIKHDITFSQLEILAFVSRNTRKKVVLQRDLEEVFDIRRSSVTSILQNMEKRGILTRSSCEGDGRLKQIILTDKGKALDDSLKSYMETLDAEAQNGFSEDEKSLFQSFLLRALANLEKQERNTDL